MLKFFCEEERLLKKIINNISDIESELLEGFAVANSDIIKKLGNQNIILRTQPNKNKVALVSGCGSGHEPAHAGFVGFGMLDCAVMGSVFTSPSPMLLYKGISEVATKKGVLCVVKNNSADNLSFELAVDMARKNGIKIEKVLVNDDVFVIDAKLGRRGSAGTILVEKIAGAAAESGNDLDFVKNVAQKAADNTRTLSVAINPCTIPATGEQTFKIAEMEMEFGISLNGEPGLRSEPLTNADGIVRKMLDKILTHIDYSFSEVVLMVNGLGATPLMELLIVNKFANEYLYRKGVEIYDAPVGNFMTCLDTAGFSITLLKLDDELKKFYDAPCKTFALKK